MMNRSIIRSTKNVQYDSQSKKVQVKGVSHHLIECDDENSEKMRDDKENINQSGKVRKGILSSGDVNKDKVYTEEGKEEKGKEKALASHRSCTLIKSRLKKELSTERKPSLPDSDELEGDVKSSKSIKFNFDNTHVFEYSHGENHKKVKPSVKKIAAPVTAPAPVDGECCQIF